MVGVVEGVTVLVGVDVRVAVGVSVAKYCPSGWPGLVNQTTSRTNPSTTSEMAPYIRIGPCNLRLLRKELRVLDALGGVRFNIGVPFGRRDTDANAHSTPPDREQFYLKNGERTQVNQTQVPKLRDLSTFHPLFGMASWAFLCPLVLLCFKWVFKYFPVYDSFTFMTCSGVPSASNSPPRSPPSGPRSISQSATLMMSRLCSMIKTELPASTNLCRTSISLWTSAACRPTDGSSRT